MDELQPTEVSRHLRDVALNSSYRNWVGLWGSGERLLLFDASLVLPVWGTSAIEFTEP